jgi:chromosome segregation ATPase
LTQENERLVGGLKVANEALEFLRVQFQTQTDLQAEFTKWLDAVSQENAASSKRNSELQAKISELEASVAEADRVKSELAVAQSTLKASAEEADRVKGELAIAQSTLRQMSEELAEARKPAKPDEVVEAVGEALPLTPAGRAEEVVSIQTAPAEAAGEGDKISDLSAPKKQVAVEKTELEMAEAETREEAVLAQRYASDQTNEQFNRIRRSMVAKQDQKPGKIRVRSLLSKFLRH